jgi:glucose-6-phosphate dehydrogenase assembly protein OpcA
MPTTFKVLGQVNPSATTATTLYTVPAATQAVVSTITVANLAGSAATFRISVRPAGATQTNAMYLAYDVTVGALDTTTLTLGISLGAADVVTVYASTANIAFNAFGSEFTA